MADMMMVRANGRHDDVADVRVRVLRRVEERVQHLAKRERTKATWKGWLGAMATSNKWLLTSKAAGVAFQARSNTKCEPLRTCAMRACGPFGEDMASIL